jgi:hypothetical protein
MLCAAVCRELQHFAEGRRLISVHTETGRVQFTLFHWLLMTSLKIEVLAKFDVLYLVSVKNCHETLTL